LHHLDGNEGTGDIRTSWVDVTTVAGPIFLKLDREILGLFSRFRLGAENRGFNQIANRFVLRKKQKTDRTINKGTVKLQNVILFVEIKSQMVVERRKYHEKYRKR